MLRLSRVHQDSEVKPWKETRQLISVEHLLVVHCILDTMGENELSGNEKFVMCFSSFLCEATKKAYFVEDNDADNEVQGDN